MAVLSKSLTMLIDHGAAIPEIKQLRRRSREIWRKVNALPESANGRQNVLKLADEVHAAAAAALQAGGKVQAQRTGRVSRARSGRRGGRARGSSSKWAGTTTRITSVVGGGLVGRNRTH
ncbi:hypothetical protein BJY26_000424 [Spelaeicoccus albus]|uniref:Uncharacterized protein n=2 Tax=Spelaeicoccus albus TaxID=1280376 RepID=A0A7Z0AAJ8_9MICO|nr:hypothetical protein [Spelaeicoccus albus]